MYFKEKYTFFLLFLFLCFLTVRLFRKAYNHIFLMKNKCFRTKRLTQRFLSLLNIQIWPNLPWTLNVLFMTISMGFLPKMYFFNLLQHITCKLKYFESEFYEFVVFFLNAQKCGYYPTVGGGGGGGGSKRLQVKNTFSQRNRLAYFAIVSSLKSPILFYLIRRCFSDLWLLTCWSLVKLG